MPNLTVLLIRHAESIVDTGDAKRLHETLDPSLTDDGYRSAHEFWLDLFGQQLTDAAPRRMACFSAPLMACHSTALFLSAADMPKYENLSWRFTVAETAKTPTAVPIIVHNQLASFQEQYECSTLDKILAAGLLHGAAAEWNTPDSRKCPLTAKLDQVQSKLRDLGDLQRWKQERSVHPPRKVLEAQFLHQKADDEHWWSLSPLTNKRNLLVDMLTPDTYLPPPRQGIVQSMLDHDANENAHDPVQAVQDCVAAARAAGCDTVLMILPETTIAAAVQELLNETTKDSHTDPLGMTACTVDADSMEWTMIDGELPIPEPIDCTDTPPEDIDPASVPPNQWSVFPIPEPENIPDDYPDLPPFGMALSKPPPDTKPKTAPLGERSPNTNNNGPRSPRPTGHRAPGRAGRGPSSPVRGGPGNGRGPVVSPARAGRGGRGPNSPVRGGGVRGGGVRGGGQRAGRQGAGRGRGAPAGRGRTPVSPTPRSPGRGRPISPAARSPVHTQRSPVRAVSPNGRKLSPHPPPHSPLRTATPDLAAPSLSPRGGPSLQQSSPPHSPQSHASAPQSPAPTTPTRLPNKARKSPTKKKLR